MSTLRTDSKHTVYANRSSDPRPNIIVRRFTGRDNGYLCEGVQTR
jgi:hypothetical protein